MTGDRPPRSDPPDRPNRRSWPAGSPCWPLAVLATAVLASCGFAWPCGARRHRHLTWSGRRRGSWGSRPGRRRNRLPAAACPGPGGHLWRGPARPAIGLSAVPAGPARGPAGKAPPLRRVGRTRAPAPGWANRRIDRSAW